ncbi:MAG: OadG family transporter subunit [SAR86 cluster bacterium]|nr:OadG family transporter subunit [SAR86 cluster bacterium]
MNNQLIEQAIELAIVGMSTVFIFLILLIFFTILMSRVVGHLYGSPKNEEENVISASNQSKKIAETLALHHHNKSS